MLASAPSTWPRQRTGVGVEVARRQLKAANPAAAAVIVIARRRVILRDISDLPGLAASGPRAIAALDFQDQRHALPRIIVDLDAIQALKALIVANGALRLNRIIAAAMGAELTGRAAFRAPGDPVQEPGAASNSQRRA